MLDAVNNLVDHGYLVVRTLGENPGDGRITWLCERIADHTRVVVKHFSFARHDADWDGYKAHEREIAALRAVIHPGVPRFLDAFPTEQGFALVQAFIDAPSLAARRSWTVDEVIAVARDVLGILVHLQRQAPAILHRDIKPANILRNDRGRTWLIDFGLARRLDQEPATLAASGTPGFMAPEQFFRGELSMATDLYGLGATLVTLFSGIAANDIGRLVDHTFRFDLSGLQRKLPPPLLAWLARLVEPDAGARFEDAATALDALEDALRAPATIVEAAPRGRRNLLPVIALAVLVPLAGGVYAIVEAQNQMENAARVASSLTTTTTTTTSSSGTVAIELPPAPIPAEAKVPRWVGNGLDCPAGAKLHLKAGDPLEPGPERWIQADPGCDIALENIAFQRIDLGPSTPFTMKGGKAERISIRIAEGEKAGPIRIEGARVERLFVSGGRIELIDSTVGRIDGDGGAHVEGTRLSLGELRMNSATATIHGGRVDRYLSIDDSVLRGEDFEIATRLYIYDRSLIALDRPILDNRFEATDDKQVVVLRAPVATRRPRLGAYGRILTASDDLEKTVQTLVATRDTAVAEAHVAAERQRLVDAVERDTCAIGMACLGREEKLKGRADATMTVSGGRIVLARASHAEACLRERSTALAAPPELVGRVVCQWEVGTEDGLRVVRTKVQRFSSP
jgi:hypothetical protein